LAAVNNPDLAIAMPAIAALADTNMLSEIAEDRGWYEDHGGVARLKLALALEPFISKLPDAQIRTSCQTNSRPYTVMMTIPNVNLGSPIKSGETLEWAESITVEILAKGATVYRKTWSAAFPSSYKSGEGPERRHGTSIIRAKPDWLEVFSGIADACCFDSSDCLKMMSADLPEMRVWFAMYRADVDQLDSMLLHDSHWLVLSVVRQRLKALQELPRPASPSSAADR